MSRDDYRCLSRMFSNINSNLRRYKMDKLRKMLPFLGVNVFAFYILPFLNMHTNGVILLLLIEIPVICFVTSLIYGIKRSFNLIYTLIVMLIFVPTIFIFYNESAAIYILIYGVHSLIGNFIGYLIFKSKR